MGGESASCVSDRAYYGPTNATDGHVNADDVGCVIEAWQSAGTRPWVIGNFAWASAVNKTAMTPTANLLTPLPPLGANHRRERITRASLRHSIGKWCHKTKPALSPGPLCTTNSSPLPPDPQPGDPVRRPDINSHFGVVDIAGFEKDSSGYYKAWWIGDSSKVYTLPATWNFAAGTTLSEVAVFAAASSAELFINGNSLGVANICMYPRPNPPIARTRTHPSS